MCGLSLCETFPVSPSQGTARNHWKRVPVGLEGTEGSWTGTGCNLGLYVGAPGVGGGILPSPGPISLGSVGLAQKGWEAVRPFSPSVLQEGKSIGQEGTGYSEKLLGWWVPTTTFGKRGETVAENPILINYFGSWDTAVLLFGMCLFWLRVGLEKPFLSIIPKTVSAKPGCFPQGRFTLRICTGVVFFTLENAAP